MIKQALYVAVLFILANTKAYSQHSGNLSLGEAWETAIKSYPGLKEKEAEIREAEYRKISIKNASLPKVQLQLQNTYGSYSGSSGAFFPLPGIFNVNGATQLPGQPAASVNTYGSVLLDWKVFEFGRQRKQVEAAGYSVSEKESNLSTAALHLRSKVSRLYISVLYNQSKVDWAQQNAERGKEILRLSASLADAGLKPGADTLLAASSYMQTLAELDDWRGKLSSGRIRFNELVPGTADAGLVATRNFLEPVIKTKNDSLSTKHPYLEGISQRILHDRSQQQIAARKIFPSLSILGGLSARGSSMAENGGISNNWSSGFQNTSDNYLMGIGLTWNISEAYNSITEKKRAGEQLAASRERYNEQALELRSGLEAVSSRIKMQLNQVSKTNGAVEKARAAYDLYLSRYESGLINLTELLQIQLLLQQSEKVNIEAHEQLWEQMILRSEFSADFSDLSNQFK